MKKFYNVMKYLGLLFATVAAADIDIQAGHSGAWIADESGQGIFINVARIDDQPTMVVTWYSYLEGNQVWLIGSLPFDYGAQELTVSMSITSGTNWGDDFVSEDVVVAEWGTITLYFADCNSGMMTYTSNDLNFGSGAVYLSRLTNTDGLSCHQTDALELEKAGLVFMREEEKLARDVYLYFDRLYDRNVFKNIANSEQTHMDAVLNLMHIYNVPDSSTGIEGTFNNIELQSLFDDLIQRGSTSLSDAYLAGALIEETDIRDIEAFKLDVISDDILLTYDALLCGSRNHLRAFVTNYENSSGNQYVVQIPELANEVEQILNSDNEQCIL